MWWCPAILRLSLGRGGEEHWPLHDLLFFPSAFPAPLIKMHLFCRMRSWGRDDLCDAGGWQTLATNQGGLGGDMLLLGWCQPPVHLERSQRLFGKRASNWQWSWGGFQLCLHVCSPPLLSRHSFTALKSGPVYLADFTVSRQPYVSSFSPSLSHLLRACRCVCFSPKLKSIARVKPGSLFPSSSFILHSLMFVILDGVHDGAVSPYTV